MPRLRRVQSSFNSGVLDPRLAARIDVKAYYNGAAKLDNCICIPQGGASRRPGSTYIDEMIHTLTHVNSGVTITTPNGGTGANANDDDVSTEVITTTNISTVNPYVIVHYDLGSSKAIKFVDITNIKITTSTNTTEFFLQYSDDDAAWTSVGSALQISDSFTSRRYTDSGTHRYWRVARIGATDLTTEKVTLAEFNLWQETATLSDSRLIPFSFNTEQNYLLVMTDRNMAVYKDDVLLVDVRSIYTSAQLDDINWTQTADTLLITHVDIVPQRIVRNTTLEGEWYVDDVPLINIPQYLYDEGAGTNEVQTITFGGTWVANDIFKLNLKGEDTIDITYFTSTALMASALQDALRSLVNTSSNGITVVFNTGTTFDVTFGGADGSQNWPQLTEVSKTTTAGLIVLSTTTEGVSGDESVWSTARGWPRTVTFFESRMVFGGSKQRPQGIWLSVTNDFFNFDVGDGLPDEAIVATLDTDQVNEIRHLQAGRRLEIFTSGGEFLVPNIPSTPENFGAIRQTQYGSSKVKIIAIDGSTIYIQRNGHSLREFLFSFSEDANVSNSITQLSTHLINHPVDIDAQRGTTTDETNYIYVVNQGGDIVVLNTLREQEINAWSGPWNTDGDYKRIAVVDDEAYTVTERTINSVIVQYIEKFDSTIRMDSAVSIASHSAITVSGLDHLEGETVKVNLGNAVQPDAVVSSGIVTLEREAVAESVEIGLEFNPLIRTMPVNDSFADGPTLNREKRIVRATIDRYQSLGIHVNGERIPDRQLDLDTFDAVPDAHDDVTEIYLHGWSQKAQIDITQVDPVPMTILAIDLEVSV